MKKNFKLPGRKEIFEKTIRDIISRKRVNIFFYFLLLALYFTANHFTRTTVHSTEVFVLNDVSIPYLSITGIFSSLANTCIIMIVVLFGTLGFITSLIILTCQLPNIQCA